MPNETSFLTVLDRVQERIVATKEIELAPLLEFDPYLSNLTATLARMDARVGTLQIPIEICDPSRRRELFLLFLDALDVDGQGQVQARICEKIASEEETEGSLSQACVAASLGLLAARSMHDFIVVCEPSLARASPDAGGARFERLSVELAGVQAGVQESVRSTKVELTQAMSMVDGPRGRDIIDQHEAARRPHRPSRNRKSLAAGIAVRVALSSRSERRPAGSRAGDRQRDDPARPRPGESANQASTKLAAGDDELKNGHFKQAFRPL